MQAQQRFVSVHGITARINKEVTRRGGRGGRGSGSGAVGAGGSSQMDGGASQMDAASSLSGSMVSGGGSAYRTARERSPGRRVGERRSPTPPPRSPKRGVQACILPGLGG